MAKTDFLTADMTRRQFMKISGRSLAGLTLSASMLSLFGCSQQQVDSGAVSANLTEADALSGATITSAAVTTVVNDSYFYVTEVLRAE